MSAGENWIDAVMAPLAQRCITQGLTAEYNRIYEAVARGTEQQGKALVAAILRLLDGKKHVK